VSDRGGAPQIYKMAPAAATDAGAFSGTYNISPAISGDGRWLATSRVGGGFKLHVMELATGNVQAITDTTADERPSFARTASRVYATKLQGR
jgi:TolB protein